MKIKIIAICNLMGRPTSVGEVIETKSQAEEEAAGYLISIGKAKEITPVISTDAEEAQSDDLLHTLPADKENASLESTLVPDPTHQKGRAEKESHGHRKTATPAKDLR